MAKTLDEIGDIHGHFLNLSVVEGLNVLETAVILLGHKVDGHAFAAKPASSANPVYVVFPVGGQVIVDDQRHLLDVNAASQQVSRDEDSAGA